MKELHLAFIANLGPFGASQHQIVPHLHVVGEPKRHVVIVWQIPGLKHKVELALLGERRVKRDHRFAVLLVHAAVRHPEASLRLEAF